MIGRAMSASWKIVWSEPSLSGISASLKLPTCHLRSRVRKSHKRAAGCAGAVPRCATDLEDIERATIERVFSQVNGDKVLRERCSASAAPLYIANLSGTTSVAMRVAMSRHRHRQRRCNEDG